ncbi:hypothetical protein B9G69_006070 [Bdellovibrio sp. SKB1291214]|uniref:hypothetical protein n=1 Tax=Bdellovibrio sp. SKB1291214 TaxID=1732569 RepID=UPI000B51B2C2|nr:hypothetical protein [Bdellovibrio sp. SKB1291214]UYL10144.1 hypothetical protein B9G69_006070 [Bdellovibrio sp. SKB1291214]
MKLTIRSFVFSIVTFCSLPVFAGFVNDTSTGIVALAGDCSIINVQEAYFSLFGASGRLGKVLVIKAQIRNDAYDKIVRVTHEHGSPIVAENTPGATRVRIEYMGQLGNMDLVEITDRTVGMELSGLYSVSVQMNYQTTTCVFQVDRKAGDRPAFNYYF